MIHNKNFHNYDVTSNIRDPTAFLIYKLIVFNILDSIYVLQGKIYGMHYTWCPYNHEKFCFDYLFNVSP